MSDGGGVVFVVGKADRGFGREVVVKSLSDDDLTIKILSVRLLMGIYGV